MASSAAKPSSTLADANTTTASFESTWKQQRALKSSSIQTTSFERRSSEVQSFSHAEAQIQTDNLSAKVDIVKDQDFPGLKEFLARASLEMEKILQTNTKSHALDEWDVAWEDERSNVNLLYELKYPSEMDDLQCTDVVWNSTGSLVAVAYGRYDHDNWCQHRSYLCVWNIFRRSIESSKPEVVIELDHCLMCISFHPEHPAIIAGGTFNGEIYLWNIGNVTDPLLASSPLSETSHKEPISKLVWHPLANGKGYQVISAGTDGRILTWAKNNNLKEPMQGCRLLSNVTTVTGGKGAPRVLQDVVQGATSISYSAEDRNKFIIGTEGGNIFRCALFTGKGKDSPCQIEMAYDQHNGPVHSVVCSPFHRNVFFSCSADSTVRLTSLFVKTPILNLMPSSSYPYAISCSHFRPLVFAVGCGDGTCCIYDLVKNKYEPTTVLRNANNYAPVYCVAFNSKQRDLLATGDANGTVRIWQLSHDYEMAVPGERDMLDALSRTFSDEGTDL
eukprot:TRINITY_DN5726_c0_g1_i4.p1 TRINITY_DN5726_c0_g1~~TRINITY_DN5726_c0_g1_i4.p1  ORF type:complete len:503 (+),score=78.27 TRINITY_DN5726_c0_g1_i4:60-1568(+)